MRIYNFVTNNYLRKNYLPIKILRKNIRKKSFLANFLTNLQENSNITNLQENSNVIWEFLVVKVKIINTTLFSRYFKIKSNEDSILKKKSHPNKYKKKIFTHLLLQLQYLIIVYLNIVMTLLRSLDKICKLRFSKEHIIT